MSARCCLESETRMDQSVLILSPKYTGINILHALMGWQGVYLDFLRIFNMHHHGDYYWRIWCSRETHFQ